MDIINSMKKRLGTSMMNRYFKFTDEKVVNSFKKFFQDVREFEAKANALAATFNATAVIKSDNDEVWFSGFKFNDPSTVNFDVWRKPDRTTGISDLRVKAVNKAAREEFDATTVRMNEAFEKYFNGIRHPRISKEPLYQAIGVDSQNLFFYKLFGFELNDVLYFESGVSLDMAVEINQIEFSQARFDKDQQIKTKEFKAAS